MKLNVPTKRTDKKRVEKLTKKWKRKVSRILA